MNVIAFPNKNKRAKSQIPDNGMKAGELREISSANRGTNSANRGTKPPGEWNGVTIGGRKVYVTYHPENAGKPGYQTEFWRIG